MYWALSSLGREFYTVEISTTPELANWEISFDQGDSWHDMDYDNAANTATILVSGPKFLAPAGDNNQYVRLTSSVVPYIRSIDNPEVIVRATPRIDLI